MKRYLLVWESADIHPERVLLDRLPLRCGRDPRNEIRIRNEAEGVSGFHARLLASGAKIYVEDVGSSNGTYVNGVAISGRHPLTIGDRVMLGRGGPTFRVEEFAQHEAIDFANDLDPATTSLSRQPPPLPPTPQQASNPLDVSSVAAKHLIGRETLIRHVQQATRSTRRRIFWCVGAGLLTLGLLGAGGAWWFTRDPVRAFLDNCQSVWKVCEKSGLDGTPRYRSIGTAWTYGEGLLATNAHVASELKRLAGKGHATVARRVAASGEAIEVRITDSKVHRDWERFQEALARFQPQLDRSPLTPQGQFDVALLSVAAEDGSRLGDPMPLADLAEHPVKRGQVIHYLGYPAENRNVDPERPDRWYLSGSCTRLVDCFYGDADTFHTTGLIAVQFPAAGGASGGPLCNDRGEVVGLLAAGDLALAVTGQRVSEGLVYGPNATLLREIGREDVPERASSFLAHFQAQYQKGLDTERILAEVAERLAAENQVVVFAPLTGGDRLLDLRANVTAEVATLPNDVTVLAVTVPLQAPIPLEMTCSGITETVAGIQHATVLVVRPDRTERQRVLRVGSHTDGAVKVLLRTIQTTKR